MRRPQIADRHPSLCGPSVRQGANRTRGDGGSGKRRTWAAARFADDTTPRSSTMFNAANATRPASQASRSYQLRTVEYERDGRADASGPEPPIVRAAFHHDRLARFRHVCQLPAAADGSPLPDRTPVPTSTVIATPRDSLSLLDACNEYNNHPDRTHPDRTATGPFFRGPSSATRIGSATRKMTIRETPWLHPCFSLPPFGASHYHCGNQTTGARRRSRDRRPGEVSPPHSSTRFPDHTDGPDPHNRISPHESNCGGGRK